MLMEMVQGEEGEFVPFGIKRNAWTERSDRPILGHEIYHGTILLSILRFRFLFLLPLREAKAKGAL